MSMLNPRSFVRSLACVVALGAGLTAHGAYAADLGPVFGEEAPSLNQNVEFGTGWYIRGSAGLAFQTQPSLLPEFNSVPSVHSADYSLEIGGGYQFNKWFRADATYTYYGQQSVTANGAFINCPSSIASLSQQQFNAQGVLTTVPVGVVADGNQCTPRESASIQKNLFLANGYIDIGTWYGITPYVGGGIGTALIFARQSVNFVNNSDGSPYRATLTLPSGFPAVFFSTPNGFGQQFILNPQPHFNYGSQNLDFSQSIHRFSFAFAFMGGIAYDIFPNAKLDIGYRYVNFGSFSGISSLSGTLFNNQVSAQEVRVGLRYLIDSAAF
jgi:opacity protein-like surface antigen